MIKNKTISKIIPKLISIVIESEASPNSLKEIVERIFIIPIEIITLAIIKGIDSKIAVIKVLGSSIGTHPFLVRFECNPVSLLGNLFNTLIKPPHTSSVPVVTIWSVCLRSFLLELHPR